MHLQNIISNGRKQFICKERFLILILVLLSVFLFGFNLGVPSLWDESEAMYTEVAREIIQTSDWITLHFNFQPWFVHPPFYMWLTALTSELVGWTELTGRIWSALFGLGSVLATYFLGKNLFQKKVGFLAGIIFATTFQTIIASRVGVMDTALSFFVTLSILLLYKGYKTGKDTYHLLAFIAASFAVLTKGPIGIILPFLIVIPYLFFTKDLKVLKEMRIIRGAAIFLIIVAPWYIAEYVRHSGEFIKYVLGYQTLGRFFGAVESQSGPWYYYLGIIPLGFLPWTAFLPASLTRLFKSRAKKESLFLLIWCIVVFAFFSLAGTKLPDYIIFIYPALSIMVAKFVNDLIFEDEKQTLVKEASFSFALLFITAVSMVVAAGCYFNYCLPVEYIKSVHVFIPLACLAIGGTTLSCILFFFGKKAFAPFLVIIAAMCFMIWNITACILPEIEQYKPIKPLAMEVKQLIRTGDKIVGYKMPRTASLVYYSRHPVIWTDNEMSLNRLLNSGNNAYYLMRKQDHQKLRDKDSLCLIDQKADVLLLSNKEKTN